MPREVHHGKQQVAQFLDDALLVHTPLCFSEFLQFFDDFLLRALAVRPVEADGSRARADPGRPLQRSLAFFAWRGHSARLSVSRNVNTIFAVAPQMRSAAKVNSTTGKRTP